jgi:hypothetical protein
MIKWQSPHLTLETEKMILELYTALKNLEAQSSWRIWEEDELRVAARKALRKTEKKLKLNKTEDAE